ncbi:hypothetical protein GMOD_00003278 [Pyrenophora seminiperda CCB06]|uniref:Uncharacterized protein n=1 Tax=Pyrenophora seminiperda CCB06 TaxID=1302712 RepID=A0A3M7MIB5_9PLEO|nr:hypothetical protein GMOD_00003278 [Pyrenophora seminiperda CCB06]
MKAYRRSNHELSKDQKSHHRRKKPTSPIRDIGVLDAYFGPQPNLLKPQT